MAGTIKEAIDKAGIGTGEKPETKIAKVKVDADQLLKPAPKTWREALDNVLLEVPKSAKKMVADTTDFLFKSLQTRAHNAFACGEKLAKVQEAVSEASFARLIREVWSRAGASQSTIYRWIRNAEVLKVAVPYDIARDALLVVTNGNGLFSVTDGTTSLTGGFTAGLKKYSVPKEGTSYEDCLDWAREVLIVAEKAGANVGGNISDVFKAGIGRYRVLLEGNRKFRANLKFATEFLVVAYRMLNAKSESCAAAALEAMEDDKISPDAAGQMAMEALKIAQEHDKAERAKVAA